GITGTFYNRVIHHLTSATLSKPPVKDTMKKREGDTPSRHPPCTGFTHRPNEDGSRAPAARDLPAIRPLLFENGLPAHFRLQGLQRPADQGPAQLFFLFPGQSRVPQGVRNGHRGHDPVSPHGEGDGYHRAHVDHGNTCSFDFFDHRCTATSTGPSRGGQDDVIHPRRQQVLGNFRRVF